MKKDGQGMYKSVQAATITTEKAAVGVEKIMGTVTKDWLLRHMEPMNGRTMSRRGCTQNSGNSEAAGRRQAGVDRDGGHRGRWRYHHKALLRKGMNEITTHGSQLLGTMDKDEME